MRKRYLVSAGVAMAMVAGSAVAFGNPFGSGPNGSHASSATQTFQGSVTLPTGDVATLGPDGSISLQETAQRQGTGYISPSAGDGSGDVVVIPSDKIADLAAGDEDPRRYNVSALLRSGQTDATQADVTATDDKEYGQFGPVSESNETAEDSQQVSVNYTDHAGETDGEVVAKAHNVSSGDIIDLKSEEDGTATAELPPGEYDIVGAIFADDASVSSVTPVTVEDEAVEEEVDGTQASPVSATVEDDPDAAQSYVQSEVRSASEEAEASLSVDLSDEGQAYVVPVENGDASQRVLNYSTVQESDTGRYHLTFEEAEGIGEELEYSVSRADLAQVDTQYQSLGSQQSGHVSNCGGFESQDLVICGAMATELPAEVTEHYNVDDGLSWTTMVAFGNDEMASIMMTKDGQSFVAGEQQNTLGVGPYGVNLTGGIIGRGEDALQVDASAIENANPDESISANVATGSVSVSRDDEELDSIDEPSGVLSLPEGDSGRYTVALESALDDELTPLGTESSAEWEFESEPTEEFAPVDLSSLVFNAADVENGYAPASEPQEFTLDYLPQEDTAETSLEEVTFEVSYDDGENWEEIALDVDGNTASGALEHNEGAKFVSYRATAADDADNKFTTTNIRSYGLS